MSAHFINKPLLGPLVALNGWVFAMEGLLYKRRIPALSKYGVTFDPATVKQQKAEKLPPFVNWAADNFNNLQEQPTQFYAVTLTLALLGVRDTTTVRLAWAYVGLRVLHSLIHVSTNNPGIRFPVFAASSLALLAMTAKAAVEIFS